MTPAELDGHLRRLDEHLALEHFVDGTRRDRGDVRIQVGLRWQRSFAELAELIDDYAELGVTRATIAVPLRPDGLEDRLAGLAQALGIAVTP